MAVTANGTPYVETSDLVANYPGVSLALANHIDGLSSGVLQVVRATDATGRATSSGSFTDASLSVTITPQKSTSAILLLSIHRVLINSSGAPAFATFQITDSSNTAISGAEAMQFGATSSVNPRTSLVMVAYATPAVTTAVTYKVRFLMNNGTSVSLENNVNTAQMYAMEVSA